MTKNEQDKIEEAIEIIDKKAKSLGLDYFDTEFLIADEDLMDQISAYVLPVRYHHWTFGKEYQKTKTLKQHGLAGTIYECVLNSDPSYGFLLETNNLTEMKLVIAHVFAHVDFFKNNMLYQTTNRRMATDCALNAKKVANYSFLHGEEIVERWIDACMAISRHCELALNYKDNRDWLNGNVSKEIPAELENKDEFSFMFAKERAKKIAEWQNEQERPRPIMEKDLLLFLMHNRFADLEDWQKDIMSIVREEMQYFIPNIQTKIANEGYACVTGDSLMATNRGFIPIKDIYNNKTKLNLFNQNGFVEYNNPHITEKDKIYKITLKNGMSINGLSRHKIQIIENGKQITKKIEDINIKDKVICSFNSNIWSEENYKINRDYVYNKYRTDKYTHQYQLEVPENLDEKLAEYIGMFIAEGHYGKRTIKITNTNFELLEYLKDIVFNKFNINAKNVQRKYINETHKYDLGLSSVEIINLFQNQLGILDVKSGNKEIPKSILQSTKPIICGFLRGLFEGDGCIYNGKVQRSIIYVSKSKILIEQLSMILNNMGIETSYYIGKKKGYENCHRLYIQGKTNLEKFQNEIGFLSKEKNLKLSDTINNYRQNKKTSTEHLFINNTEWILSEIISIEEIGEEKCYDLTVPNGNVYVANGILNHNTFWHQKIIEELDMECNFLTDEEGDWYSYYAAMNAGVLQPGSRGNLNPYLLGYTIWKNIYDNYDGTEKEKLSNMFDIRATHNDSLFIKNYLTEEIAEELDLFTFELLGDTWTITDTNNWERSRDLLSKQLLESHIPTIYVVDDDYNNNRELLLMHDYKGDELKDEAASRTLAYLAKLWKRPVTLRTGAHFTYETTIDKENDKKSIRGENLIVYMNHDGKKGNAILAQEPNKPILQVAQDYFDAKWRYQKFDEKIKENASDDNII